MLSRPRRVPSCNTAALAAPAAPATAPFLVALLPSILTYRPWLSGRKSMGCAAALKVQDCTAPIWCHDFVTLALTHVLGAPGLAAGREGEWMKTYET